jgi:putative transposase
MFGCQPNIVSPDKYLKAVLEFLCSESSKLTNCRIYYSRQMYFKAGKIPSRSNLHKVLGTQNRNQHYRVPKSFVNFLLPNREFGEGWGGVKNLQLLQGLLYKAFYSDTAQQILTTVAESFK